ncbi:MAG: sensor histidine kinase [Leadbetterella sp.]
MKHYWLICVGFVLLFSYSRGYCQSTLKIVEFKTSTYQKDSVWNTQKKIKIPYQPNLLVVKFAEDNLTTNKQYICIIYEVVGTYDTLQLGSNTIVNFYNLKGGNYTLTFKNLDSRAETKINFTIELEFWQKWWFTPFIFLITFLVIVTIFYFIYLIQLRTKLSFQSQKHVLEMKAMRAQMNPHFIFNSMNTIDAYILRKRFVEASDFLQKFSKLIRNVLENSERKVVPLTKEIETLGMYVELEQERFSHSFDYAIHLNDSLKKGKIEIPSMILQPFVENSILHGIRHLKDRRGQIIISISPHPANENLLVCSIDDNGIGMEASSEVNKQRNKSHNSMGVQVTLERIQGYQSESNINIPTQVINKKEGTRVELVLPIEHS